MAVLGVVSSRRFDASTMTWRARDDATAREELLCHPEPGAPAGGIRLPIARTACGCRAQRRAMPRPEPPGAARKGERSEPEHGEDGEDVALPGASTAVH